jgi:hypothetical protein
MVKFSGLILLVAAASMLAVGPGGSSFQATELLMALVGMFAIVITFLRELPRVLH